MEAPYFVWEENGEVLAGVEVKSIHWAIKSIPGLGGKIIVNVIPKLPFISHILT